MISTSAQLEFRLFKSDRVRWRALPKKSVVGDVQLRVTSSEGYGDGTFYLAGVPSDYPDLVRQRRIQAWVRYRFPGDVRDRIALGWSGYVQRILPVKDNRGLPTVQVTCYGFWGSYASRCRTMQRYANPEGEDRSEIFKDIATRFVANRFAPIGLSVVVSVSSNATTSDIDLIQYDAYRKTFGNVGRDLAMNVGLIAVGADVDPATGNDRLFFRPYDDATLPARHTIHVPGKQIGATEREVDTSSQATVLYLEGGAVRYPNLLAQATSGNTLFNYPIPTSGDAAQNLLLNGGFDTESPREWTVGGSGVTTGSFKQQSDEGITPYNGGWYLRLDNVGEFANQNQYTMVIAPVAGRTYICDARCRSDFAGKNAVGQITVQWTDAAGAAIGAAQTVAIAPTDVIWDLFAGNVVPPAGATGAKVTITCTAQDVVNDQDYALLIDQVRIYDPTQILQAGYQFTTYGDAHANALDWANQDETWTPGYGYSVYLDVVASNADGHDARIEAAAKTKFSITGGMSLTAGFIVKLAPGSPNIELEVEIDEYLSDGSYEGNNNPIQTLSSTDWTVVCTRRDFQESGSTAGVFLDFRGSGQLYIGGAFAFDTNRITQIGGTITGGTGIGQSEIVDIANPDGFTEEGIYEGTVRADALYGPGTAIGIEAAAVGDLDAQDSQPAVIDDAGAAAYGLPFFGKYALGVDRPNLEIFGVIDTGNGNTNVSMMPGELVRAIGPDGQLLMPVPLPVDEKLISVSRGKLSIKPSLQDNPRDPVRAIETLVKSEITAGTLSSAAAASSGGGGGASGVGEAGGGTGPVPSVGPWSSGTSYSANAIVYEDNILYLSIANNNLGNDPSTDGGVHWVGGGGGGGGTITKIDTGDKG